jgi:hypothetical protein
MYIGSRGGIGKRNRAAQIPQGLSAEQSCAVPFDIDDGHALLRQDAGEA